LFYSPPLIGSDHNTVHFNVALPASSVPIVNIDGEDDVRCYYNFSPGDYDGLNNYLSSVNWDGKSTIDQIFSLRQTTEKYQVSRVQLRVVRLLLSESV